ncbi:thiamine pyrophosphate-binding protein [Sulfuricystis multivorans]|uniref:thiamine pyrophosphate-binding protein n=1 Tax=Sulfuricystis multivorans TaxID=2211108 RepID=UPI000F8477F9|nr:thiamine pyrophosphate-binding protein [Sulfuricystis multivorans]
MQITVAALITRFMERLGLRAIYGMPGSHILPVYDAIYDSPIKTVLVKHEQGAAFMACGEARATRRPAACITTAGPGATNLVTGIANAYADKLPLLIITGETSTSIFGKGGLQESSGEGGSIDQSDIFRGITRYHRIVERTDYLLQVLRQATRILLSPNAGPVLLSFPYNIQKELVDADLLEAIRFVTEAPRICNSFAATEEMGRMIRAARHPVIVAGHGCFRAGAQGALQKLGERHAIRVATTLKGKGLISENDPRALGCLGVTSDGSAFRHIVEHADLIIVLGASFNERTSNLWDARLMAGKRVIQVDHDASQLEKVFRADLAIHGDIRAVLEDLLICLADFPAPPPPTYERAPVAPNFTAIAHLFDRIVERLPEAMIFDDNIILAQTYLKASPQHRYFPNSGVSALGHAIPAAIGARCAVATPTFAILGDGGFQMCCMELMTAVNYRIPVNIVMINNGTLGLIRKNQFQLYRERYIDCDFVNPDFALLAQSFGIRHFRIETAADVDRLFDAADLTGGINLIEVMWDKNVFPTYRSDR